MIKNGKKIIVGLDIGTTKVCAIVGKINQEGVEVLGVSSYPSRGLKKGVVINLDSAVDSIKRVIEEAEAISGLPITSVYTGIAGSHIQGFNSHGIIAVRDREIKEKDVKRVIEAAKAVTIPLNREVIHILPQEFIVDDQSGIRDPLGLYGTRLEAKVHIVTGAVASAQNIIKCANRTGLKVKDIVLQQLASGESVLTPDEKEMGVVLIDIGGGTTDIAVFFQGGIKYTSVLPLGGNHLTSDIAIGLRTPLSEAEEIKKQYGSVLLSQIKREEAVEVPKLGEEGTRIVPRQFLCEIIRLRMEEILLLIDQEITKSGYKNLMASGVVITGGSSLLEGLPELAEQVFNLPVKIGRPNGLKGLPESIKNPIYATGVGLVLYGSNHHSSNKYKLESADRNIFSKIVLRMKRWFEEVI